jgi:hypothetical protein
VRNASVRIPLLTGQEVARVLEDELLDTWIEENGAKRAFRTACDMPPVVHLVVDKDTHGRLSRLRILALGLEQKRVHYLAVAREKAGRQAVSTNCGAMSRQFHRILMRSVSFSKLFPEEALLRMTSIHRRLYHLFLIDE